MRAAIPALIVCLALPVPLAAQVARGASVEAQNANRHYDKGWKAMRAEAWDEAAREFQQTIDIDPRFALAYYSLGRAHMAQRNFVKAIGAYTKCREIYIQYGGEDYNDQMARRRRLEDQILEYRTAINQASQTSGIKAASQTQSLMMRELQAQLKRLEDARDRDINITLSTGVPFYVSMALGSAYFRSGQFGDAEREYKAALEANASSGETHNNLAVLYLMTDRPKDALKEVTLAEQTGFKVNPNLKADIQAKAGGR